MSIKKHKIKYESEVKIYPNIIQPIKTLIPKWYKDLKLLHENKIIDFQSGVMPKTMKNCVPFLDALTTGYAITLPHDIAVGIDDNGEPWILGHHEGETLIRKRENKYNQSFPKPNGYHKSDFAWRFPLSVTVPVGCSYIFTHPFNRFDLPFLTLTGVIDGGYILNAGGNVPFFIKEGFEGVIEKGTPIAQLIPFQHAQWSSEITPGLLELGKEHNERSVSHVLHGWYKKTWWTKKQYD